VCVWTYLLNHLLLKQRNVGVHPGHIYVDLQTRANTATHTPSDIPTPVFEMRSGRERGSMPGSTIMNKGICIIIPHKQHSDCIEKARQEGKDIDYAIRCDVQGGLWRCFVIEQAMWTQKIPIRSQSFPKHFSGSAQIQWNAF
jgi:hypothetical protein